MQMGMSQSFGQRVEQMTKLELSQKIKQLLRLLLSLLQTLRLTQRVTIAQVQEIHQAVAQLETQDLDDLAYELVRQGGLRQGRALSQVLQAVAEFSPSKFSGVNQFALALHQVVIDEEYRRDIRRRREGPRLALLMIMCEPDFLGGLPGTPENLAVLLKSIPQIDDQVHVQWLLAGGWAVELLTGKHLREHHDIDCVVMTTKPLYLDTDEVNSDDYFGTISCTPSFLQKHCMRKVAWQFGEQSFEVAVLCPEFLFLSKFLDAPREKDWDDVVELVKTFSATWDLNLMSKLIRRNTCSFTRTRELMAILRQKDSEKILAALANFWPK